MKGSIKIVQLFNIPVKLHWSFGSLIFYIIYIRYARNLEWEEAAFLGLSMLGLFFCVILHEYGHALTARKYGVETRDIILLPIGGFARLEKLPEKPIQEFYVAIAGPLVNAAIVVLLIPLFYILFGHEIDWENNFILSLLEIIDLGNPLCILPFLLLGNIMLVGFNLLPAFPMDGGRVFRSLLSIKLGRLLATRIAAYLGSAFGIFLIILGVYTWQIILVFLGGFVLFVATQEYRMVKMEANLRRYFVSDIFRDQFTRISITDSMAVAIEQFTRKVEKNFLVFDEEGQLAGVLQEAFILEAIRKKDTEVPITNYLSQNYEQVYKTDNLDIILKKMQQREYSILPVFDEELLVGVVDVTMMNNFLDLKMKTGF